MKKRNGSRGKTPTPFQHWCMFITVCLLVCIYSDYDFIAILGRMTLLMKVSTIGSRTTTTAITVKEKVIGRSHKKLNSPSLIIKALRKFSSIIPPNIKPSNKGASGKLASRRAIATIAIKIMMKTSTVLKETK